MLNLLGRITTLRAKTVLGASIVFAIVSLLIGSTAIGGLTGGGYQNPGSDSAKVFDILEDDFKAEEPHLTIAVGMKDTSNAVSDPEVLESVTRITENITDVKGVSEVVSFWQVPPTLKPQFQSGDGSLGLIFIYINPESLDLKNQIARDVDELIPNQDGNVEYYVGGAGAIYNAINGQISSDIYKAELISIPLTMILLLFVFGALVAAGMPLIVGLTSIAISLFGLWIVSRFTEVSVFALNLITGLGLGLGIDYSLLIVNRFREELAKGFLPSEAVRRTLNTAGKTVVYSGVTVALTLSSMVLFPQPFLQSFAYAGVLVCLTAVFGAIVPLAATLTILGEKVNSFKITLRPKKRRPLGEDLQISELPKISLITSVKDADLYIEQFMEDVVNQSIFNEKCEWIIINVNPVGKDFEEAVIKRYQEQHSNITYVRLAEDPGVYEVWNMAIKQSSGDFITNLNCDDRRESRNIEKLSRALVQNPDVSVVYSDSYITKKPNLQMKDVKRRAKRYRFEEYSFDALLRRNLPHNNPMWRRSLHNNYGYFSNDFSSSGDWEFWLRVASQGEEFMKHPEVLGVYYKNPHGLSTNPQHEEEKLQIESDIRTRFREALIEKTIQNEIEARGFWSSLAQIVMKRPFTVVSITTLGLVALLSLAVNTNFSQVDDRVLPKDNQTAIAAEVFRQKFTTNETSPIEIIVPQKLQYQALATDISNLNHIVRVETPEGVYTDGVFTPLLENWPPVLSETDDYFRLRAITDLSSRTYEASKVIEKIRVLDSDVLIGGAAADYTDSQNGITDNMERVLLWVALMTFIVLFLFTGSILLPIKAVLLNILSLGATLGVLTWIFEYGNLMWLTGDYTVTGSLDTSSIVLVAIVTFGLSMDYELFLLSRIKEEHDHGKDTATAVKVGLQKSGKIITAAALLLAVVFAAFVTSGVTNMKMLGFGIAFAILLDATVVRGLLVPAFMRIANSWNWWAPAPLRRLHQRFGLKES
ncbi:MAG: MMPL family transporter [Candidatus Nanopelagicales bacterium]